MAAPEQSVAEMEMQMPVGEEVRVTSEFTRRSPEDALSYTLGVEVSGVTVATGEQPTKEQALRLVASAAIEELARLYRQKMAVNPDLQRSEQ